jgi:hypothetical protein
MFKWNNGGTGGALDLEEGDGYGTGWLDHDCGYYPNWVDETRAYLDDASHADVNVILWSWCGQASSYTAQQMTDRYLSPMARLETEYPGVRFVYMTGHSDGSGETGTLHLRNRQIRDYCLANGRALFDFYDIECYDPDGNYFGDKAVNDNCDYDSDGNGTRDRNWALDWQAAHTVNEDWYDCGAAHSQSLNANLKAYAAWWLFAGLAGWDRCLPVTLSGLTAERTPRGVALAWRVESETGCCGFHVWRGPGPSGPFERVTAGALPGRGEASDAFTYEFLDAAPGPDAAWYKLEEVGTDGRSRFFEPVAVRGSAAPAEFRLSNHPNPFNAGTLIRFSLAKASAARLTVRDGRGRLVAQLWQGKLEAGAHRFAWDGRAGGGRPAGSGVYAAVLETSEGVQAGKMLLVK